MMHALFENKCRTTRTKQFLPLQSGHLVKDGHRLNKTLKPLLTHCTDWSQGNSQPTGHEIRKMGSNSQVRWTLDTGQVPKRIVTWRWHKVRRLGSDKIKRKITGWQQATEMDGSNWATAESSKTFNGRAPLFHHHHHLPTNIPFQKNYLVFHISGSTYR